MLVILLFVGGLFGLYRYMTTPDDADVPDGAPPATAEPAQPDGPDESADAGASSGTAPAAAGANLHIRVEDADGAPVSGTTVRVLRQVVYRSPVGWGAFEPSAAFPPATSAEDGTAEFVAPGALAGAHILAFKGSAAARTGGLFISPSKEREIVLKLAERPGLDVIVHGDGDGGEPLAGATALLVVPLPKISRLSPSGSFGLLVEPVSAEEGRFRFPPVPHADDVGDETELFVHATAPGHLPAVLPCPFDRDGSGPVRVSLVRSITVRGRVVRADDTPVGGARVVFDPPAEYPLLRRRTVSANEDGAFAFTGLPARGGTLLVDAGAAVPGSLAFPATEDAEVALGDVRVETGGSITGHVVDAGGDPVARVHVYVATARAGGAMRGDETDAKGRFLLRDLGPGAHRLFAREGGIPRGWEPRTGVAENVAAGSVDVEIVLAAERLLHIELAFAKGHEAPRGGPSKRILVRLTGDDGTPAAEHLFRDVESVRVRCAAAGPHRVEVEIEGYLPAGTDAEVLADGEAKCSVELRRAPIDDDE